MRAVHSLVAEVFGELIYPVKSTNDEAFEIQLIRNAQIHFDVERVVMRNERAGKCPAILRL